jgi:hypothetical protein
MEAMSPTMTTPLEPSDRFRQHCKIYYQKSLSLSEERSATKTLHDDGEIQASQVVLDALEHQIGNHSQENDIAMKIVLTDDHKGFLNSDRVKQYSDVLESCKLLLKYNDDGGQSITTCSVPKHYQQLLIEYTQVKDEERRLAHVMKMKERKEILHGLLEKMNKQVKQKSYNNRSSEHAQGPDHDTYWYAGEYDVRTQKYLSHVRTSTQEFVGQNKQNIGTHSLLAGIRKIIEKQIEMENQTCLWRFRSSVISESCFGSSENQNGEKYMKDTVCVLSLFMVYHIENDLEASMEDECEYKSEFEDFITFRIHPGISDSFLKYIVAEIPSNLDAKPTGSFQAIACSDNVPSGKQTSQSQNLVRKNLSGEFDESMFVALKQWSDSFCEIL